MDKIKKLNSLLKKKEKEKKAKNIEARIDSLNSLKKRRKK